MNTREIATEYRKAQWTQMLQERIAKGESIKEFCENRGVSRNTYFYWQRKLRAVVAEQIGTTAKMKNGRCEMIPRGWAQVQADEDFTPKQPGGVALSIEIGGYKVAVGESVTVELLAKVCGVLKSLC